MSTIQSLIMSYREVMIRLLSVCAIALSSLPPDINPDIRVINNGANALISIIANARAQKNFIYLKKD